MSEGSGDDRDYKKHYSEESFWEKLKKHAMNAGKKAVYAALLSYYAVQNPSVPFKAKMTIYGALGYLILPVDLVPDFLPAVGYGDDLAALLYAVGTIATYLNKEVKENALGKMAEWFGPVPREDRDILEVDATIVEVEKGIDEAAGGGSNPK
ncbi:DUF1232 domain-containing protein [Paenibacillus antri]|uniref:DUF1232 domain-containing protein n=1 Tax=Paenibacillus antri TaxID=2582848 RepID=A0A5R9G326_9BACL|nr:YkvA family protein [Paenibacillus antri]TLS50762.1 DUF1232 domain-containing protein [Paenibacillus antri]